jgi:hypothetical protein
MAGLGIIRAVRAARAARAVRAAVVTKMHTRAAFTKAAVARAVARSAKGNLVKAAVARARLKP